MDLTALVQQVGQNLTPVNVTLFTLLMISEVLGANDKFKANGIYMLIKAVLVAIKDQVIKKSE